MKTFWMPIALILAMLFGLSPASGAEGAGDGRRRGERGDGQGRSPNPLVLALDADGDGEVSPTEMRNAEAALRKLDRDGDGELSREELRPQQRERGGEDERGGSPRGDTAERARWTQQRTSEPRESPRAAARPTPINGFVPIPAGEFEMGDHHSLGGREHRSDEIPIHKVRVDGFHIATIETTNQQYCEYLNSALSQRLVEVRDGLVRKAGADLVYCDTRQSDRASGIEWDDRKFTVVANRASHPVVCIRCHGAAAYCNWLSAQKGYEPCYDTSTWACDYSKESYRLPTEAEWEYAGRGGQYGPYFIFPWGDEPDSSKANWPGSADPYETGPYPWTTPVGFYNGKLHRKTDFGWPGDQATYQTSDGSNGYGLYDMSGNVWEWVNDWYDHHYYNASPAQNPPGPTEGQRMRDGKPYRALRSGSWFNGQWGHGRVANRNPSYYRGPDDPDHRWYHIGFRVVLSPGVEVGRVQGTSARRADEREAPYRREDRGAPRDGGRDREQHRGRGGPLMNVLDVDRDGELSAKEMEEAANALRRSDSDRDGNVTVEELRGHRGGSRRDRDEQSRRRRDQGELRPQPRR